VLRRSVTWSREGGPLVFYCVHRWCGHSTTDTKQCNVTFAVWTWTCAAVACDRWPQSATYRSIWCDTSWIIHWGHVRMLFPECRRHVLLDLFNLHSLSAHSLVLSGLDWINKCARSSSNQSLLPNNRLDRIVGDYSLSIRINRSFLSQLYHRSCKWERSKVIECDGRTEISRYRHLVWPWSSHLRVFLKVLYNEWFYSWL
jgi:hypothetical protein